jgi:hypothetical protein
MALKAAMILLCLCSCSACDYWVEPIDIRMDGNQLKTDGLFLKIRCNEGL